MYTTRHVPISVVDESAKTTANVPGIRPSEIFEPLDTLTAKSSSLAPWRSFRVREEASEPMKSYVFIGPRGGGVPIRLALIGGMRPGEWVSAGAIAKFLLDLDLSPFLALDYALFGFPLANPVRPFRGEPDFERDFWRNSTDPGIRFFERELTSNELDGVIGIFCDQPVNGFQVETCSRVIATEVLWPALEYAQRTVPLATEPIRLHSTIQRTPEAFWDFRRLKPRPFSLTIRTPRDAAHEDQIAAVVFGLKQILSRHRSLLAHAESL
jgi:hypothetical protein